MSNRVLAAEAGRRLKPRRGRDSLRNGLPQRHPGGALRYELRLLGQAARTAIRAGLGDDPVQRRNHEGRLPGMLVNELASDGSRPRSRARGTVANSLNVCPSAPRTAAGGAIFA